MSDILRNAVKKVSERRDLSEDEMFAAMNEILEGNASEALIAAFLIALRMKGESVDEITGAARLMREKALPLPLRSRDGIVDVVGTGGDDAGTFNISTAAAFVAAGAGVRIAKHGNRSVSSRCGSADVMEALGIAITIPPEAVATCIDEIGIGFLFAPTFHRAMKHAAPVRASLGIRTIFNILGPLTNPADAQRQLIGVYHGDLAEKIAQVLRRLGKTRALVVYGEDGLDEITVTGQTIMHELRDGALTRWILNPASYGIASYHKHELLGGTARENAALIEALFRGAPGAPRDCVLLNAGAAIMVAGMVSDLADGIRAAAEAIDSGAALRKLNALKELSHKLAPT
ncbi:MAG: anthranilate phosphoribosyltransferase [Desulfobacterota bacterium]|nr:anthranilate phosphoribosyltransferase [Thermodesulfobacteriota bacterium]